MIVVAGSDGTEVLDFAEEPFDIKPVTPLWDVT